jgi:hypothetical protein
MACGFRPDRPEELIQSLFEHVSTHLDTAKAEKDPGSVIKLVCEGPLKTPSGRRPWARSVWQVSDGEIQLRLITAFIHESPKDQ